MDEEDDEFDDCDEGDLVEDDEVEFNVPRSVVPSLSFASLSSLSHSLTSQHSLPSLSLSLSPSSSSPSLSSLVYHSSMADRLLSGNKCRQIL